MARVLIVDDAYTGINSLSLAGAGNRNLPVSAALPSAVASAWSASLAVGNRSGAFDPRIQLGQVVRWESDPLGTSFAGFAGVVVADTEFVVSSQRSADGTIWNMRLTAGNSGTVYISPGAGAPDGRVVIESVALGTMIVVDNDGVGFNGGLPAASPPVAGSRGGNVALASLLNELASMGLITDNTTP